MKVPNEESETGTSRCGAHGCYAEIALYAGDKHKCNTRKECYRTVKTVNTVCKVYRVYDTHDCNGGNNIIEKSEVNLADKRNGCCCTVACNCQNCKKSGGNKELENQLLWRCKTEVTLFYNLDVIINKADKTVCNRKTESAENEHAFSWNVCKE